jgi:hypothetical protein
LQPFSRFGAIHPQGFPHNYVPTKDLTLSPLTKG